MKQIQRVAVSSGEALAFSKTKKLNPQYKRKTIYSFFPCDRGNCECQGLVLEYKNKFPAMNPVEVSRFKKALGSVECPRDKSGMNKYSMVCNNCGEIVAQLYATDEVATDWCDFHYISYHNGKFWQGALTPSVSPIDELIGMECCCGNDSRDFRANKSMPAPLKAQKIAQCSKGRKFGQADSKYKLVIAD